MQTLEASRDDRQRSGIGLQLLLKDYDVKLGARFEPAGRGTRVTMRVFYFLQDF